MAVSIEAASLLIGVLLCISFSRQAGGDPLTLQIALGPPYCSRRCDVELVPGASNGGASVPQYQCSCSRSCSVYGDCCYDSPYRNASSHKTEFICLAVSGHGRYKAVSSCSSSRMSDFCKDGLGSLPPVTSRVTNVTYANRFCAICNEDRKNLVQWNVELKCPTDGNAAADGGETARYIYRSDDIWSLNEKDKSETLCKYEVHFNDTSFMKGLELRTCSNIEKKSSCVPSWTGNSDVLEKCMSYVDPVFVGDAAYRNAHCAECNFMDSKSMECVPSRLMSLLQAGSEAPELQEFCRSRGLEECIRSLGVIGKGGRTQFHGMFYTSEKVRCGRGQIRIYGRCKQVMGK